LIIRDAVAADVAVLIDLFRRSSLSNERDRENLHAHPEVLEYLAPVGTDGHTRVAVADDGAVAGFVTFLLAARTSEVSGLFVDPNFRTKESVGRLLDDAVASLRSLGVELVEVTENAAATGFYEKAGFVVAGEVPTRFGPAPRMRLDLALGHPLNLLLAERSQIAAV